MIKRQQVQSRQQKRLQAEAGTGYLFLDRLKELQALDSLDTTLANIARIANRIYFKVLKQICCIDLDGKAIGENARQRPVLTLITSFVLSLYCLFTCHIIVYLYYQYSYDFNLIGLMVARQNFSPLSLPQQLNQTLSGQESATGSVQQSTPFNGSQHELNRILKMEASKKILAIIGSPKTTRNIFFEAVNLYVVILSFVAFGLLQAYYRYVTPFDLYQIREQLDAASEHRAVKQLVKQVVVSYCKSNELLEAVLLKYRLNGAITSYAHAKTAASGGSYSSLITRPILLMMLSSGSLMPANRSRYWASVRAVLLFGFELFLIIFLSGYFAMLAYASEDILSLPSLVQISRSGLMITIGFAYLTLGGGIFIASIDQIVLVNKLIELIKQCIRENSIEFASYADRCRQIKRQQSINGGSSVSGELESTRARLIDVARIIATQGGGGSGKSLSLNCHLKESALKMNANLLFTLMHYKIFVQQWRPIRRTLDPGTIMTWTALILGPISVRLHMPYMKLFQAEENRFTLAAVCLSLLLPVDCGMLPLHHLNTRCACLYRELSSLAAHMLDIESKQGWSVYDSHAVLTLLKELRHPDRFIDQFVTRCGGMSGTYSTLVKVHFWWGLAMISILIGTQSNGAGLFDSFLRDPFDAFSSEG